MSKELAVRVPGSPGSPFARALLLACLSCCVAAAALAAAWVPGGAPLVTATGSQSSVRTVTDGRGGFIAAWVDTNGGSPRILAQRVDSTGVTQWTAGGVLVTTNADSIKQISVAADGQNGILLAWTARRAPRYQVYAQRLNASGQAVWTGGGMRVDPASNDTLQGQPNIIASGVGGGAFVAWSENRGATDYDVYVQRINADSTREWTTGGVDVADADTDDQVNAKLLADGLGGAWVSWEDASANPKTYFQLYDDVGTPQWASPVTPPTNPANTTTLGAFMGRLRTVSDTLLVVWNEPGATQVMANLLSPGGTFLSVASNQLRNGTSPPFGLIMQTGGTAIAFMASTSTVYAAGVLYNSQIGVNPITLASTQTLNTTSSNVHAVSDGANGAYAVWASVGTAYARHVTPAVTSDWGAPVAVATGALALQSYPAAVGGQDLLVAWLDGRNLGPAPDDIFMQRVAPNGVTGTYYRINATIVTGTGAYSAGGGRTWIAEHGSLPVRWAGTSGYHIDRAFVGGVNLGSIPNYTFTDVTADSTLQTYFLNTPYVASVTAPASSYRAFSTPTNPTPAAVSSIFANLMPYDTARWRLGHWDVDSVRYVEPTAIALTNLAGATGYWFIGTKDTTLSISGFTLPEAQYSMTLRRGASGQGWNQFGSPFRFPVAVDQLRLSTFPDSVLGSVTNIWTDHQILEWNPSIQAYETATVIRPEHAYWLWRQSATAVSLNFPFTFDPVLLNAPPIPFATRGDWSVDVIARAGAREARLEFGAAAVVPGRWNGLSSHALPSGPGDDLSLVARVSDWGEESGDFRSVFRPDAAELRYDFDASARNGLTETALTFTLDRLPVDRRVVLSEPATGWSREIKAGAGVPLVLSSNVRHLRLEVLAGSPVTPRTPLATALRAVGPNPFHDATTLSFSIAHAGPLRWDVFDLAGRRLASGARTLDAGEHTLTWDGRDAAGVRARPGLYLVRWQADGAAGAVRVVLTD